ncbi:S-layer homology domain-containing protein [Paenibacillus sp. SI8]|uniref:S-layer homology domain-containing protein n=1 Tax=unclassified Paenibacillus TaxID=185978 RepID=UPI003466B613
MKSSKLTTLAISAIAFSMLSSAALANPSQTAAAAASTSDFTDLAGIDAGLKAKIDAMISAGIFEGVSNTSFGLTQNMTRAQFAKVATLIYGIKVDPTVKVSSFSDVLAGDSANGWAIPYIEAAKKAGLIDGVTDTTFVPGDSVTTGQLDTVLLKGLGKKVSVTGTPWYSDAVKQATGLGIHAASKAGDQSATRSDLVLSSYAAQGAFQNQTLVSVKSVQADSDNKKVQVTLNKKVDTAKATLTLNKGTAVVNTTTEWSSDGTTATLVAKDGALTAGDYTVTLGGLDAASIQTATGKLTISAPTTDTGNVAISGTYVIPNVLDSGITDSATGLDLLATKAEAENPALSQLAKEIEIKVTSGGEPVAIPGVVQSIQSSNPSVVKAAVSADHHAYVLGNKPGTADVLLIVRIGNNDDKQLRVTVTVKSDSIAAKTVKAGNSSIDRNVSVATTVYAFDAYTDMDLSVIDNYDNKYEKDEIRSYNFALGTIFIANDIQGASGSPVGTVSINSSGKVTVTGNVTSFELTAVLPSGAKATSYVTLKRV